MSASGWDEVRPSGLSERPGRRSGRIPLTSRGAHACLGLALTVAIFGSACSSAAPNLTGPASLFGNAALHPLGPLGPLASLVTAPGIDVHGSAVHVTSDFTAESPYVVAVAQVGGLPGRSAPLTITWFQIQSNGTERLLFTHHLSVAPGDKAYSVGASTGRFALGLYLVVASLDGARMQTPFMVTESAVVLRSSALPSGPGNALAATTTRDLVPSNTSSSAAYGRPVTLDAAGSPPVGAGSPPVSGPSGVVSPPSPAGSAAGGCQLTITGDASATIYIDETSCAGDTVDVSVDVDGHNKLLGTLTAADVTLPYGGNPCTVDPNLGFDPVPISYTANVVKGPDVGKTATISGTTAAVVSPPPRLILSSSNPEEGVQVVPGQGISMTFQAQSDSGIKSITVTRSPGGVVVADQHFGQGTAPTRCHPNQNFASASAADTVPTNPPPVLTYTAVAIDFAGHQTTLTIEYPTEAVWVGRAFGPGLALPTADFCAADWNVYPIFVAVSPQNGLSGSATASTPGIISCPEPARDYVHGNLQGSISLGVTGTYDGSAFRLQFHPGGVTRELGNGSISVLFRPSLVTVVVTRTSNKQAQGMIDVTQACPGGGCTWHLTMEIWLVCCGPYAGQITPPAPIPRPPIYIP